MHWLLELLGELLTMFTPWGSRHVDRSQVGESRLDRDARRIGLAVLVVALLLTGGCLYLRR